MAQDSSIEQARVRIQRLVEEIATLSRKEMRSEEYFQQFLTRAVQSTDARGGAIWLVAARPDGKNEFQLGAQVEFESSVFHSNEQQHAFLLREMAEVVQTKKPLVAGPEPPPVDPGSMQAQMAQLQGIGPATGGNKTPYPFFHVPLFLKEQVLGVLQIWLQPYVGQANYPEFITFLTTLTTHVEQHFHSRRLGNLVLENQRLQQVLKFSSDLAGSLDPLEVARLSANYGRDLIGCERCSVLSLRGDRWSVTAISGQETVEPKGAMVKAMVAFVDVHAQPDAFRKQETDPRTGAPIIRHELLTLSKKELIARAEASATATSGNGNGEGAPHAPELRRTDEVDLAYFEHSHVVSAAIAPMFDAEQELIGAFFAESSTEGFFDGPAAEKDVSGVRRLTDWLAIHTGKALRAAQDYKSLPLLAVSQGLRNTYHAATGRKRKRFLLRVAVIGGLLVGAALYPKMDKVDGNCIVAPISRAVVVPEVPGRVEKVIAREGMHLKKGDPIAQLDTTRLEVELEGQRQEYRRARAEGERLRAMGDEAEAQVASLQSLIAEKNQERLRADIASATLRSPIDGVVLTKDLELHVGEFLQQGTPFAEVAALDDWELQLEINEREIGKVERELIDRHELPINYILYSHSAHSLHAVLSNPQQISAMAYPREKENVFVVTVPHIQVPEDLRQNLRPGLTGRAKIDLGREPLAWWSLKSWIDWVHTRLLH